MYFTCVYVYVYAGTKDEGCFEFKILMESMHVRQYKPNDQMFVPCA